MTTGVQRKAGLFSHKTLCYGMSLWSQDIMGHESMKGPKDFGEAALGGAERIG